MKKEIAAYCTPENTKIFDVITLIESNDIKIALIINETGALTGTITDGDIRRAIMRGISFEEPAISLVARTPTTLPSTSDDISVLEKLRADSLQHIILVDNKNRPDAIKMYSDLNENLGRMDLKENWVVLMAGGLGQRLRPLTEEIPKPMLEVGGSPILETLINNFKNQGFYKFYICINYLGDMIKDYFGDGSHHGVKIRYIEETEPLHTAGAISLIEDKPRLPFFVVNGDIVTGLNFNDMLNFHSEHQSAATMAIREHAMQVPYGVIEIEDYKIQHMKEKPTEKYYVNAGIYLLEPDALDLLETGQPCSMPDLFDRIKQNKQHTFAFPIKEYWIDVGRFEDFERANLDLTNEA